MNKADLLTALAAKSSLPKTQCDAVLGALAETISEQVAAGGEVAIPGVGRFSTTVRKARSAKNPRTGEPLQIPERRTPTFAVAKALKDAALKN